MSNINRRLAKIEKKLCIGEKTRLANILGMEVTFDEFREILEAINGKTKGVLPSEEEHREYQALCAGDTEICEILPED